LQRFKEKEGKKLLQLGGQVVRRTETGEVGVKGGLARFTIWLVVQWECEEGVAKLIGDVAFCKVL